MWFSIVTIIIINDNWYNELYIIFVLYCVSLLSGTPQRAWYTRSSLLSLLLSFLCCVTYTLQCLSGWFLYDAYIVSLYLFYTTKHHVLLSLYVFFLNTSNHHVLSFLYMFSFLNISNHHVLFSFFSRQLYFSYTIIIFTYRFLFPSSVLGFPSHMLVLFSLFYRTYAL